MKQSYFNGLSNADKKIQLKIISNCIKYNYFYYLQLIFKYKEKNKDAIKAGINFDENGNKDHPLILLLKSNKIMDSDGLVNNRREYLKLYLNLSEKCDALIPSEKLVKALELINKKMNLKNSDYAQIVQDYAKRNSISIK